MDRSWLVQRLNRPFKSTGLLGDNPFSFGGGLKNGGLSEEAMSLIRSIWEFDYMGSAEFEFGAVPEALQRIAKSTELIATHFLFDVSSIKMEKWELDRMKKDGLTPNTGLVPIYIICDITDLEEIISRVSSWAHKAYETDLKETTHLQAVLTGRDALWHGRTGGWLELDNGFFFFTDEEMFNKTVELFGVTHV